MITSFSSNRRQFLGQASCAAVSSIPVLNTLLNLSITEKLSAVTAPANGEYRALVCLFLSGGNDSFNMLVPREASAYAQYQSTRSNLALAPAVFLGSFENFVRVGTPCSLRCATKERLSFGATSKLPEIPSAPVHDPFAFRTSTS